MISYINEYEREVVLVFIISLILLIVVFFALQDKDVRAFFAKFGRHMLAGVGALLMMILLGPARFLNMIFSIIVALIPFLGDSRMGGDSKGFHGGHSHHGVSSSAKSSENEMAEALEILELTGNPNKNDVETSYRKLIKKHHPDKGGSKYFTRKIIRARKILLEHIDKKRK